LVGGHLLLKGFWVLWDNIYDVYVVAIVMVMLLWDLEPCGIIFMLCALLVIITVAMVMLFWEFGPYGIILITTYVYYSRFSRHS
jgi:hypothetical protein